MKNKEHSKHLQHIRATRRCSLKVAKKIAIKENIEKAIKAAKNIEELKHQLLRVLNFHL